MSIPPHRSPRPMLLYRATCPKCRLLSALVVALSLGSIARIPAQSPEAARLYARFGQPPGRLALVYRDAFRVGWTMPAWALLAVAGNLLLIRSVRLGSSRRGPRSERPSG